MLWVKRQHANVRASAFNNDRAAELRPLPGRLFRMASELTLSEMCEAAAPGDPIEHLVICPVCGQIFDCRDDAQMKHHANADAHAGNIILPVPHGPLNPSACNKHN